MISCARVETDALLLLFLPHVVWSTQHLVKVFVTRSELFFFFFFFHLQNTLSENNMHFWQIHHSSLSPQHPRCWYSRIPVWAWGQSINMNCVLHYFQMSEAVRAIIWAFSPTFCHLSPILGPRGHVKIESDSQSSMLNRLIGLSCHGRDQSSLTPGLSEVLLLEPLDLNAGQLYRKKTHEMLTMERKCYQTKNCSSAGNSHTKSRLYTRFVQ